jgi:hypothetical protein
MQNLRCVVGISIHFKEKLSSSLDANRTNGDYKNIPSRSSLFFTHKNELATDVRL